MENSGKRALDEFGSKFIPTSRDLTILEGLRILEGSAKSPTSKALYERLKDLTPEQIEAIKDLIIDVTDGALNNFLWVIEQEEKFDLVAYENSKENCHSLKEASDGLCGEYWSFVDKYSSYKRLN